MLYSPNKANSPTTRSPSAKSARLKTPQKGIKTARRAIISPTRNSEIDLNIHPLENKENSAKETKPSENNSIDGDESSNVLYVKFPSCSTHLKITGRKAKLVTFIIFNQDTELIDILMEDTVQKEKIIAKLLDDLDTECNTLCSMSAPSMLRKKDAKSLMEFSFKDLLEEVKGKSKLLHDVVLTVCCTKKANDRNTQKTTDYKVGAMGMAVSILLKCRNKFMSAAQIVTSLSLGRAHISKMVSN
ncbi:hypothetical protein AC249_AIPGENE24825 [Exaiptasia diaphana]|nr:hypothetical protein AC249_AIPGENE24825 [Exaiptasia diaphana]